MKAFISIFILLIITGCASTTVKEPLSKIYSIPEEEIFISITDVINKAASKSIGGFISSEIDLTDPVFFYGDNSKYRSSFELYHFKAKKDKKYKISITSYFMNSGFGLEKHTMIPLVYILDSEGNIINQLPEKIETVSFVPARIVFDFEGLFSKPDKYFILIGADNRFSGKTYDVLHSQFTSFYSGVITSIAFSSDIIGFPLGNFEIKIFVE